MDQAAPSFHALSADVEMTTWTAILQDTTVENGTLKMQRKDPSNVRAVIDFSKEKDAREIAFLGRIIEIYYPKLNLVQDYDMSKNTDVLNQFLLLGFGSSGKELAQNYDISAEGTENVAGHTTTKLLLLPKSSKMKETLSKIEMWIPEDAANPVQQQFYGPSGNYRKITYTHINLHPAIKGNLEMKLPRNVKRRSG
ncbi:MAG TPA: outer membrane lipoprotein-sorting protein [Bryobacteraceae bacterium]|jgi:outer membrane lipoprotein-sorting protein